MTLKKHLLCVYVYFLLIFVFFSPLITYAGMSHDINHFLIVFIVFKYHMPT